jgi:hypothetical protein
MNISNLPGPDTVIKALLVGVFGPTATIVSIFVIVNFLCSWFGVAKSGVRLGEQSMVAVSTAYNRVVTMRPATVALGSLITACMLLLQVVWLWSAYRISNGLAYLWDAPFGRGNPQWSGLVSYVRWDWISTSYMLTSILALIWSYAFALGHGRSDAIGRSTFVLALPLAIPWGAATFIGSLLTLLDFTLHWLSDHSSKMPASGWTFIVVTLLVISYMIAVSLALRSTMTLARIWRFTRADG